MNRFSFQNVFSLYFIFVSAAMGTAVDEESLKLPKLHQACLKDAYINANELILDPKVDINAVDPFTKDSALHILVERAQFNKKSINSKAAEQTASNLITTLVQKGAKLDLVTDSGWTALNKALYLASDLVEYPLEVIDTLLTGCKAVNTPTRQMTPLHFAVSSRLPNGRSKLLTEKLIEKCGKFLDYNAVNSYGWNPMKAALAANSMDAVAILKKNEPFRMTSSLWKLIISIITSGILGVAGYLLFKRYQSRNDKGSTQVNTTPEEPTEIHPEMTINEKQQ